MIEEIIYEEKLYAIIIRNNFTTNGIKFFTPKEFSQQLGYIKREKGYKIKPHIHNLSKREIYTTQEVLLIKEGELQVNFYDTNRNYFDRKILYKGDVILLAYGGHGFHVLEDTEMIEIKQGPYLEEDDKIKFE